MFWWKPKLRQRLVCRPNGFLKHATLEIRAKKFLNGHWWIKRVGSLQQVPSSASNSMWLLHSLWWFSCRIHHVLLQASLSNRSCNSPSAAIDQREWTIRETPQTKDRAFACKFQLIDNMSSLCDYWTICVYLKKKSNCNAIFWLKDFGLLLFISTVISICSCVIVYVVWLRAEGRSRNHMSVIFRQVMYEFLFVDSNNPVQIKFRLVIRNDFKDSSIVDHSPVECVHALISLMIIWCRCLYWLQMHSAKRGVVMGLGFIGVGMGVFNVTFSSWWPGTSSKVTHKGILIFPYSRITSTTNPE